MTLMTATGGTWPFTPGEVVNRAALHDKFGGKRFNGIAPSNRSPHVMVFTQPSVRSPYADAWKDDGLFHYEGEGRYGDQTMTRGNKAVHDHLADGRALHVFVGDDTRDVGYYGEFVCVDHYVDRRPDLAGVTRDVIVFRLRPQTIGEDAWRDCLAAVRGGNELSD